MSSKSRSTGAALGEVRVHGDVVEDLFESAVFVDGEDGALAVVEADLQRGGRPRLVDSRPAFFGVEAEGLDFRRGGASDGGAGAFELGVRRQLVLFAALVFEGDVDSLGVLLEQLFGHVAFGEVLDEGFGLGGVIGSEVFDVVVDDVAVLVERDLLARLLARGWRPRFAASAFRAA